VCSMSCSHLTLLLRVLHSLHRTVFRTVHEAIKSCGVSGLQTFFIPLCAVLASKYNRFLATKRHHRHKLRLLYSCRKTILCAKQTEWTKGARESWLFFPIGQWCLRTVPYCACFGAMFSLRTEGTPLRDGAQTDLVEAKSCVANCSSLLPQWKNRWR